MKKRLVIALVLVTCFWGIPGARAHDEPRFIKNRIFSEIPSFSIGSISGTKYKIYWDDGDFAGNLGPSWDLNSVLNDFGSYGSTWGIDSIWNPINDFKRIYIYEIRGF